MDPSSAGCGPDDGRVVYRSWMSDNTRWDAVRLRPGDIVISAPPRCGTTWTQRLVSLLIFDGPDLPDRLPLVSPWLDMTARPVEEVVAALDAQKHRRFIKTHTPLDGLVLDDRVTYLGVGRDPRDAAVSMLTERARMSALREVVGPPRFAPPGRGMAEGLSTLEEIRRWLEGPVTGTEGIVSLATILHHYDTIWSRRRRPNVAMFHYADFEADLAGELVALAEVLDVGLAAGRAAELAEHATLSVMRAGAAELAPTAPPGIVPRHQGPQNKGFFGAGGSREWGEIFTEAEHRRYRERTAQLAAPDLLAWAGGGRRGLETAGFGVS